MGIDFRCTPRTASKYIDDDDFVLFLWWQSYHLWSSNSTPQKNAHLHKSLWSVNSTPSSPTFCCPTKHLIELYPINRSQHNANRIRYPLIFYSFPLNCRSHLLLLWNISGENRNEIETILNDDVSTEILSHNQIINLHRKIIRDSIEHDSLLCNCRSVTRWKWKTIDEGEINQKQSLLALHLI